MELNVVVCEDVAALCDYFGECIEKCFGKYHYSVNIHKYYHPGVLLKDLDYICCNVFFLDIDMPDVNGIVLASKIRKHFSDQNIVILFISDKEDLVYESLKEQPLRFIRKSHFKKEISEAVRAVVGIYENQPDTFFIEQNGTITALHISDIFYIESAGRILVIHTENKKHTIYGKLDNVEEKLAGYDFIRIHKSFLVNWKVIYSIESKSVILTNQETLPMSKYRITAVKQTYRNLMEKHFLK